MTLDIVIDPQRVKKMEKFFGQSSYKDFLERATGFNRKMNEERKMRIPYIDGQTGVAQRHYSNQRFARERMPGRKTGQILSYPQKEWKKKRYQYLKFFMQPRRFDPDSEMHTISQIENPSSVNEDSNHSTGSSGLRTGGSGAGLMGAPAAPVSLSGGGGGSAIGGGKGGEESSGKPEWYYEDDFEGDGDNDFNSDSDFEYEEYNSKRKKGGKSRGGSKPKGGSKGAPAGGFGGGMGSGIMGGGGGASTGSPVVGGGGGGTPVKRRTHADNIPDSEKPFSCERGSRQGNPRRSTVGANYRESGDMYSGGSVSTSTSTPDIAEQMSAQKNNKTMSGKDRAPSLGYCDFCLGDAVENKKTSQAEELVSCAECGRSGHPTCLQFSANMLISVKEYPWQCIECKCCTLCGTSENDDQLLFCDDCDRGYHMYCLVPPLKEPPEGSWSCKICMDRFHKK